MTKEKYLQIQLMVIQIGQVARQLDLESFLKQINDTETSVPVGQVSADMFTKGMNNLRAIKELAEAIVPVKKAFEKTFQAIVESAGKEIAGKMMATETTAPEAKL